MAGLPIVSGVIQEWTGELFCRAWQSVYWQRQSLPKRRLAKLRASEFSPYVRLGFRIQTQKHSCRGFANGVTSKGGIS
jgi:hypothetical protein